MGSDLPKKGRDKVYWAEADGGRRQRCREALGCCSPSSPALSVVFLRSWTLSHGRKKQEGVPPLSIPLPQALRILLHPPAPLPAPCLPRGVTSEKRPEASKKQGLV